jgi:hypothetical protein
MLELVVVVELVVAVAMVEILVVVVVVVVVVVEGPEVGEVDPATHVAKRVTFRVSVPKVDSMDHRVVEVVAMEGPMVPPMEGLVTEAMLITTVLSMVPVKVAAMAAVVIMIAVDTHLVAVEEIIVGREKSGNLY